MRMKRLLTGVLSAALLGATPLALTATSAEAKTTVAGAVDTIREQTFDEVPNVSLGRRAG